MATALTSISGIGPAAAKVLEQHGFDSAEAIAESSIEQLSQVPGFGPARSDTIIRAAIELTGSTQPDITQMSTEQASDKPAKEKKKPKKDKKPKDKKDKKGKKSKDKKKDKKSGKDKKDKKKHKKHKKKK